MNKNKYIKSPLNYVGGKYKLLDQIIPLFPNDIKTFVDVFGGGFNVGINIDCDNVIYNEIDKNVFDIINGILNSNSNILNDFDQIISEYNLNKTNKDGYLKLRENWNEQDRDWKKLYMLICHAFNHSIRFNKQGKFNIAFGKDRSEFNPKLRKNFVNFRNELLSKNISMFNLSFENLFLSDKINNNCFIYCDPPYLLGTANYNENGGWTNEDEDKLLNLLDSLNDNGYKFALSNVLTHKGLDNNKLIEWSKKYKVHYLNFNYNNCSYHKSDENKNKQTVEVLITNY